MFQDTTQNQPVTVLGKTFSSDQERRNYFREELRKKLPELKQMEGFPIGEDEDILNLSDPPFYTACPNPWLNDFIEEWEEEKKELVKQGKRKGDFEVDEPYAADVSEGKNNPIYNAHSYHTKVPHPAIMRYILHYTQPGDIIFDGFAGTGMTGVAASLCGVPSKEEKHLFKNDEKINWGRRKSINGDLSPIASFITSKYNTYIDNKELFDKATKILEDITNKYPWIYETLHSDKKSKGIINFVVWSEVMICKNCSDEIIYWDNILSKDRELKENFNCNSCGIQLTKKTMDKSFETFFDKESNQIISKTKYVPVLINYIHGNKRYDKIPDNDDLKLIEKCNEFEIDNWLPTDIISMGDKSNETIKKGYTRVNQLFTKRNLIILSEFWKSSENDHHLRMLMTSVLTKTGSILHNIGLKNGKLNLAGALPNTFYIPSFSAERNILTLIKGKLDDFSKVNFNNFINGNSVNQIASASHNLINSNSIDYIFTDPPFGANIMYSELNFIQESWLKVITNNKEEAIQNKTQNKNEYKYHSIMTNCFIEFYRILKPGKWMTVEFSNTSAAIWNGIQTAIQKAGFIISNVTSLDKGQGSFNAQTSPTAVKQDLVISCYKPSSNFDEKFKQHQNSDVAVWDFVEEHLHHLPVHLVVGNSTTAIIERSPKILFDRLIAFYVQRGLPVPIDAGKFQHGLKERFIERDGMFFTNEQVQEYDKKKSEHPEFIQLSLLVSSEQDGVLWLKNLLLDKKLMYSEIQPQWMQALAGVRKGDVLPELAVILEENFLKDESGKWFAPDPENEADLEKLRNKRLFKLFEGYKEEALKPKGKLKEVRVEALRVGFKQCYQDKDFKTIVLIGDSIPNNLLMEDEVLLQFYDIASSRV